MEITLVAPTGDVLNQVAERVLPELIQSAEIQEIIDGMFVVARGERGDKNHRTMVGLAAPQVGISKRIILVGVNDTSTTHEQPDLRVCINPEITFSSEEVEEGREGCYSTGEICGIVSRAYSVRVKAHDRAGDVIELNLEGFPARIVQHEIDHLDGIRFPDRIKDENNLHWVEEDQFGDYRLNWRTWPHKATFAQWKKKKGN